jgi:16S rRNA processing protein RimM
MSFAEIKSREAAGALLGAELMAEPDAASLPAGQYYHYQLLGLAVYEQGIYLGRVIEILSRPANDIYIMQEEKGGEIWIPALKSVVKNIDLTAGRMEVELPEGL